MATLLTNISSLVPISSTGEKYKSGADMSNIGEIKDAAMLFDDKILWLGTMEQARELISKNEMRPEKLIDLNGKTVMPGFVDSHTHIVFAGDRSNEFNLRLKGATYEEISNAGGGIQSSLKATRLASVEELVDNAKRLALEAISHGTTTIEIKSGYGLTMESEMKMLEAIKILKREVPLRIKSTFLGAHDFPPEYKNNKEMYIDIICGEMLPAVAELKLAEFCDAFVDKGYYTIKQGEKIFIKAKELGLKIKCHADELADVGAASMAANLGALSADHLLYISEKGITDLEKAGTVATLLPGTAYFIRLPYAPARKIIDSNVITALATDCNPGSCFTQNMQTILSLAVFNMKMTAEEALTASTLNGAAALELSSEVGSLEVGKFADFIILDCQNYTDLFYHFGVNHAEQTWISGKRV